MAKKKNPVSVFQSLFFMKSSRKRRKEGTGKEGKRESDRERGEEREIFPFCKDTSHIRLGSTLMTSSKQLCNNPNSK